MPTYTLYHTDGCHLCDLAESLLSEMHVTYKKVDIANSECLVEQYGVQIPVLYSELDHTTLNWPFDEKDIHQFITA